MKPVVSREAVRAALFVIGGMTVAIAAIVKMFKPNLTFDLSDFAVLVGTALSAFAAKFPGDKSEPEFEKAVENGVADVLGHIFPGTRPVDLDDTLPGLGPVKVDVPVNDA